MYLLFNFHENKSKRNICFRLPFCISDMILLYIYFTAQVSSFSLHVSTQHILSIADGQLGTVLSCWEFEHRLPGKWNDQSSWWRSWLLWIYAIIYIYICVYDPQFRAPQSVTQSTFVNTLKITCDKSQFDLETFVFVFFWQINV